MIRGCGLGLGERCLDGSQPANCPYCQVNTADGLRSATAVAQFSSRYRQPTNQALEAGSGDSNPLLALIEVWERDLTVSKYSPQDASEASTTDRSVAC
jgi:hypothetical protein